MSSRARVLPFLVALSIAPGLALGAGIAITGTTLTDDGDGDGFADSRETVDVQLTVENRSGLALTGVTATFQNAAPLTGCLTVPTVNIGNLAVGEVKSVGPLTFVTELDRTALGLDRFDDLSVTFDIRVTSDLGEIPVTPQKLIFDLDLDVSGGSGSDTLFESFEPGDLGAFEIDNMDQNLDSPTAIDGWRCQDSDPDWVNSKSYDRNEAGWCYPGPTPAHADAVWWGLSGPAFSPEGGRAFTGLHSLFYGFDFGEPKHWTTPVGVIEAARTIDPIALQWSGAAPTLSFKHQVDFYDTQPGYVGKPLDRGVVMVQLADDAGDPIGNWFKIYPHYNGYSSVVEPVFFDCQFDPIDDGNTEDDFFRPWDPDRRLGPSSTCNPDPVFAQLGGTSSEQFDPQDLGRAEGPGLAGQWGIGTWVESEFDLSRFRGRQIRFRFLASASRGAHFELWDDLSLVQNPGGGEDGWWIDDVEVTGLLATPASVDVDTEPNGGLSGLPTADADSDGIPDACDSCAGVSSPYNLDTDWDGFGDVCDGCPFDPLAIAGDDFDHDGLCVDNCPYVHNAPPFDGDADGDGFGDLCDCAELDPTVFPEAPEINDGIDNQCPGDLGHGVVDEISGNSGFHDPADKNAYSWTLQQHATLYHVARADAPDFGTGCTVAATASTLHVDADPVPAGASRFYLVRAVSPNVGSWGQRSDHSARIFGLGCSGP